MPSTSVLTLSAEEIASVAGWPLVIGAIREGHRALKADVGDTLVTCKDNSMLVRSAWIDGLAAGVKAATVVPGNSNKEPPLPSIHAQVMLFCPQTGRLTAILDGTEITRWKTAADSALGSDLLSRENSKTLLMVGAGTMATPLIHAHLSVRPGIENVLIYNRTPERAQQLIKSLADLPISLAFEPELDQATAKADIICCATMTVEPILRGERVKPGTHVDLVGAYTPNMREADDELHRRGRWFVDSYATTLEHIGELRIPIESGLISPADVLADLQKLVAGDDGRRTDQEITVYKNGGGAHLDIMVSQAIAGSYSQQHQSRP